MNVIHSYPKRSRVGLLVPSSNITIETELPALLRRQEVRTHHRFSVHSQRLALQDVTLESLWAMNRSAEDGAELLSHASVDVIVYGCLIAALSEGPGAHRDIEARLTQRVRKSGQSTPVISSAGALIDTLQMGGFTKVGVLAPYHPALTEKLVRYFAEEGIHVHASRSLNVTDNLKVGMLDPMQLLEETRHLPDSLDAVVLSACVQMPSLEAIAAAEDRLGLPVLSALTATTSHVLKALNETPRIEGAGSLLSARHHGYFNLHPTMRRSA